MSSAGEAVPFISLSSYVNRLGVGTYAEVERRRYLGIDYAVKIGSKAGLETTELREIACVRSLRHPNVVEFLWVGLSPRIYMVMELALDTLHGLRPETSPKRINYIYQLLCAVAYIHSCHIVHRDINPRNILIYPDDQLKLADFGLSRAFSLIEGNGLTWDVVTLPYKAPDVILGRAYDEAIDLWSVGCVIHEMYYVERKFNFGSPLDTLNSIFQVLGHPPAEYLTYPKWEEYAECAEAVWLCFPSPTTSEVPPDFLELFNYFPERRPSCLDLIQRSIFNDIRQAGRENFTDQSLTQLAATHGVLLLEPNLVLEWKNYLHRIYQDLQGSPISYFQAVEYFHVALAQDATDPKILALTCLWLAQAYCEIRHGNLTDLTYDEPAMTSVKIEQQVPLLCQWMNYQFIRVTPYHFYQTLKLEYPTRSENLLPLYIFTLWPGYQPAYFRQAALWTGQVEAETEGEEFSLHTELQLDFLVAMRNFIQEQGIIYWTNLFDIEISQINVLLISLGHLIRQNNSYQS